ncbi:MAG TPA: hypothetical protein VHE14_00290 [Solirubrobacteraceae bacterium]|nr:hypothetical protein [Solirubrobacteraceae bacterium]
MADQLKEPATRPKGGRAGTDGDETKQARQTQADAIRVGREHQAVRDQATKDVAERNRKAHQVAKLQRQARDKVRASLRKGLDF